MLSQAQMQAITDAIRAIKLDNPNAVAALNVLRNTAANTLDVELQQQRNNLGIPTSVPRFVFNKIPVSGDITERDLRNAETIIKIAKQHIDFLTFGRFSARVNKDLTDLEALLSQHPVGAAQQPVLSSPEDNAHSIETLASAANRLKKMAALVEKYPEVFAQEANERLEDEIRKVKTIAEGDIKRLGDEITKIRGMAVKHNPNFEPEFLAKMNTLPQDIKTKLDAALTALQQKTKEISDALLALDDTQLDQHSASLQQLRTTYAKTQKEFIDRADLLDDQTNDEFIKAFAERETQLSEANQLIDDIRANKKKQPQDEEPLVDMTGGKKPKPESKSGSADETYASKKSSKIWLMEQDSRLHFTDSVVKRSELDNHIIPAVQGGISISYSLANAPYFKGKKIEENSVIFSTRTFGVDKKGNIKVGKITQDHKGVVRDISTENLSDEEKSILAMKEAKMILTNYIGKDDIIISGPIDASKPQVEQANKIYAALLMLKQDDPFLAKVNIISLVKGCVGPGKDEDPTQHKAKEDKFIKKHLNVAEGQSQLEKNSVKEVSLFQKQLKKDLREAKAEEVDSVKLQEEDIIQHGKRQPR